MEPEDLRMYADHLNILIPTEWELQATVYCTFIPVGWLGSSENFCLLIHNKNDRVPLDSDSDNEEIGEENDGQGLLIQHNESVIPAKDPAPQQASDIQRQVIFQLLQARNISFTFTKSRISIERLPSNSHETLDLILNITAEDLTEPNKKAEFYEFLDKDMVQPSCPVATSSSSSSDNAPAARTTSGVGGPQAFLSPPKQVQQEAPTQEAPFTLSSKRSG